MTTQTEALKLALVALDIVKIHYTQNRHVNEAITAIKEALAQPEQEPEFVTHNVDKPYDWSEWVCPNPSGYLMKCCDCGLVHEAEFGVVRYKSETEREDCDMVDDPNLQAVFRMRRSEKWSPEDTAHRAGGLPMAQPEQEQNLKLMPREATPEMLKAMDECSTEGYDERLYEGHAGSVYMAAWDAFHGQHCYCGDITNLGVIHRDDGPCHYPEHTSEYKRGYADAMNWKVQNHLEHLPAAQPEQEPVAWMYQDKSTHQVSFQKHMKAFVDHSKTSEVPLYGKPLANHELQCVCGAVWCGDEMVHLPNKTPPQPKQDKERCVSCEACIDTACGRDECPKGWPKAAQPEQEPVAWLHTKIEGVAVPHRPADLDKHPDRWTALYKDPKPCPTCEALARTVMLDQTSHDTTPPQRKPLTDEEIGAILEGVNAYGTRLYTFARAIEAKLKEKNTK